jgi:hypothetical protein
MTKTTKTEGVLFPMGGYVPIRDVTTVDEEQQIARGKIVDHPDKKIEVSYVYFSRQYLPEANELDQILTEKVFKAGVITDYELLLVPKEKLLFGWIPPGTIHLPTALMGRKKPRIVQ